MVPFDAELNSAYNPIISRANPSLKTNPDGKNSNMVLTLPTSFDFLFIGTLFQFRLDEIKILILTKNISDEIIISISSGQN